MRTVLRMIAAVDAFICRYVGMESQCATPSRVQWSDDQLMVLHAESYKRHLLPMTWQRFSRDELVDLSSEDKSRLGVAVGQSITKGLVVSFNSAEELS